MVNETIAIGVVKSISNTDLGKMMRVVTGTALTSVPDDRSLVVLDVLSENTAGVQAGDLVFIRGTMRTQGATVDGVQIQRTVILASVVDRMVAGPCRIVDSSAVTPDGIHIQLHNMVHLVGFVIHPPNEKRVSDTSVMYQFVVGTEREYRNGRREWTKTTDYNRVVAWNLHWIPKVIREQSVVEVDGHIQTRPAPIGTAGKSYQRAEVIVHRLFDRTGWEQFALRRMTPAVGALVAE